MQNTVRFLFAPISCAFSFKSPQSKNEKETVDGKSVIVWQRRCCHRLRCAVCRNVDDDFTAAHFVCNCIFNFWRIEMRNEFRTEEDLEIWYFFFVAVFVFLFCALAVTTFQSFRNGAKWIVSPRNLRNAKTKSNWLRIFAFRFGLVMHSRTN